MTTPKESGASIVRDATSAGPDVRFPPVMPRDKSRGIAIVGAGEIVRVAHLPAYQKAGFNVVGITDVMIERAKEIAAQYALPRVYAGFDELLADRDVDVVDFAVYPSEQPDLVERAAAAGKHMLCQKPLAPDFASAERIVNLAQAADIKLAVNQQMRWDAAIAISKGVVERGWLGEPTYAAIHVHVLEDMRAWPWIYAGDRVEILYNSIHFIDSLRYLFGSPRWVVASGTRMPSDQTRGETKTVTIWEYECGLQVLIDVNLGVWQDDRFSGFRFEGTEGLIQGTFGLLYSYPECGPDTVEYMSRVVDSGAWFRPQISDLWVPDAFVGPMASLLRSIEEDSIPETSGEDNLKTLQLVFAAYKSMAERRAVSPDEITGKASEPERYDWH